MALIERKQKKNRLQGGFTLVEIMVAITITTLLLYTIYGVFSTVSAARERLEQEGEEYHRARVLFDRVGRELRGTFFSTANHETRLEGGTNERGNAYLTLTTTAATPFDGREGGISLVRYEVVEDHEHEGELALARQETRLFDPGEGRGTRYLLARGIESMGWRFYRDGTWEEEWSTDDRHLLPQVVELSLELRVGDNAVPFRSAFELPALQ